MGKGAPIPMHSIISVVPLSNQTNMEQEKVKITTTEVENLQTDLSRVIETLLSKDHELIELEKMYERSQENQVKQNQQYHALQARYAQLLTNFDLERAKSQAHQDQLRLSSQQQQTQALKIQALQDQVTSLLKSQPPPAFPEETSSLFRSSNNQELTTYLMKPHASSSSWCDGLKHTSKSKHQKSSICIVPME